MAELQQDGVVTVPLELADLLGDWPGSVLSSDGSRQGRLPPRLLPLLLRGGQRLRVLLPRVGSSAGQGGLQRSCL